LLKRLGSVDERFKPKQATDCEPAFQTGDKKAISIPMWIRLVVSRPVMQSDPEVLMPGAVVYIVWLQHITVICRFQINSSLASVPP
jgi:hypothetical protein